MLHESHRRIGATMTSSRARQLLVWLVLGLALTIWLWPQMQGGDSTVAVPESSRTSPARGAHYPAFLPAEAHRTIDLIQRNGPYPHRQDGGTFGNREGRLPRKPRGWYREFTVDTPGLSHRGARRIVTGGDPPSEWYYTDDHYNSFRQFEIRSDRP